MLKQALTIRERALNQGVNDRVPFEGTEDLALAPYAVVEVGAPPPDPKNGLRRPSCSTGAPTPHARSRSSGLAGSASGGGGAVHIPALPLGQAAIECRRIAGRPGSRQPGGHVIGHGATAQRVGGREQRPARTQQLPGPARRPAPGRDLAQPG